jgi:hypothetical protein
MLMETFLYLSLIPEALVFSQLPPERFGKYLAIGDKKLTRGPAIFFKVDPNLSSDVLRLDEARNKCRPHADGSQRRSTYVSVYQALANVPVSALQELYLTTSDGIVLELKKSEYEAKGSSGMHLYQEVSPVTPMVASPLEPLEFCRYVTDPVHPVYLPRMVFCDLRLDGLAKDPEKSSAGNLPYSDINHLRECLTSLKYKSEKMTKIVHRDLALRTLYATIDNGFYVGDQEEFAAYPVPSLDELENEYTLWWNSATAVSRF